MPRISDRDVQRIIDGRPVELNGYRLDHGHTKVEKWLAEDLRDARETIERLTRAAEAKETEPKAR